MLAQAGDEASISIYSTGRTDVLLVITGYFVPAVNPGALSFYPLDPCRVVDTRLLPAGPLAGPALTANTLRTFPLADGPCRIPSTATAFALNATAIPAGPLDYLALIPAAGSFAAAFSSAASHLALDVNGYFAAPGAPGELRFYPVPPCHAADTRTVNFGAPMRSGEIREFAVGGKCSIPSSARAYSVNVTAIPSGPLSYLTLWPAGTSRPVVSTLNSFLGNVGANSAIVSAGFNGSVDVFTAGEAQVILDVNGYFQ